MSRMDVKLQEALRLIAENPEVIRAAIAMAASPTVPEHRPTVAEMWAEWAPWGALELGGEESNTWKTAKAHRAVWDRTLLLLDDGRKVAVAEMLGEEMTPRACEIYRSVRQVAPNGRRRKDGTADTVKPSTVNRELCTMQSLLNYFVRVRKTLRSHPMVGWGRVNEEQYARKTYLSDDKARRFIEAGPPVFQEVMTVCLRAAGMRQAEARLLRKSEIDWEEKTINLPGHRNKNRCGRSIPIPDDVEEILRGACSRSKSEYVFANPRDPQRLQPVSAGTWQGWLKKARERSGVVGFDGENVCTHSMRHKAVTDLIQAKVPESSVGAAAGMSPVTLKRYSKFGPEQRALMRASMNQLGAPATPITSPLSGERKDPRPAHASPRKQEKSG